MDVATGAMGSLLLKLGDLLTDEYNLQAKVKEDVQYLKRELTSMYAALRKVGDVPPDQLDHQVKIWADDVRDLSYEMEDTVHRMLVRAEGSKASAATSKPAEFKRLMKKMSNMITKGKTLHEIADELKDIKAQVMEATDPRDGYKVNDVLASPAGTSRADPRLLNLYKGQKELVGIDEPLSNLTKMLTPGDTDVSKQLKIVSIVGFGGLGKTSLAEAVYDKLRCQFDCSAFVRVGQKPDMKKLLSNIIFEIDKQKYQGSNLSMLDESQLIYKLRCLLETKRYFIVIDDIWDKQAWEIIRCAFVDSNCASRIITTTRILEIATTACEVYKLKPLSHDLSKELFLTRLFGGKDKDPCDLPAEVYEKMLHKCGGAPLAIITMASFLVSKPVEVWSKVYNSIGFGYEDNKDVDNMRKILLFSYYDLPSHLRACLLYMGMYPEDHLIEKDSLIQCWVAEGFIHVEPGVGLYETGEKYFNELVNKSMIMPIETTHHGIITGCRVHYMMLDILLLLSKEENFFSFSSAEHAVKQSGAPERDGNSTVPDEAHIFTSSDISTLLDGSVRASLGAMRALVGKLDMLLLAPPQGCSSESVKDRMQFLRENVEEISSYVDELSEVEEPPPTAKCWMNEALDLSCDIEDYIDGLLFLQPAEPSRLSNNIKSTRSRLKLSSHAKAPKRLKPRHEQIAGRVSEFSMFVQKAIELHQRYDLHSCSALTCRFVSLGPMLPMRYEETAVTVIDGRMNKFINSLANDEGKQIKVISVLGSSSLGKTTLATALYNKVGKRFHCRAFIRVSRQPDMKKIFHDMLSQIQLQHPTQDCKEIDLIHNIKTYLQDKRYLIILDDVWDASVWDTINHAFPKGSHGSRIITTTQVEDVALTCCCYQSEHVFHMKPLDGDHSRKLFFNILFGYESNCPEQFKGDLNKIVQICGGLPLATISIASLIASQPAMTKDVLKHIHKSLSSRFLENSISERTRQALNLSFNNLPQYLKSCLLYLSMCPEGYEFCKHDLVKQWVTEGFIDITEGQDIKKVAESYLDQLIGRRFIQPICISYNNEVVSCAVHDAVHDFIVHKSAEENFIVAINHSQNNVSLSHMVRRLSILFGDARYAKMPANISKPQIRSLKFSGLFECMPCIRDFKLLRVLNLHLSGNPGDHDSVDLTGISELFLLRYLKIACDFCIELPKAMGELQCLETLDLMDATRVTAFPWDIIHLPHLLHLTLPVERNLLDWIASMGDSITSLWNLGKLNNLHDLHLTSSSTQLSSGHLQRSMEALGTLLGGHGNLKTLALTHNDRCWHKDASRVTIFWDGLAPPRLLQRFEFSSHSCITFSRVPQWVKELGNLCILKITVKELQMNCVDILGGLPALTALSLYVETAPIDEIIFGDAGFSVLKYFKFRCSAPWLKFEADAMPTLGKLMLGFNAIPAMDQHQHGNAVIRIEHMPGLKEISAKIGGVTANADAISALRTVVSNHESNPTINVQLLDFTFYGHESTKQKQQPDEIVGLLHGETN